MLDSVLLAMATLLALYGLVGVVAIWFSPALANSRLYGPGMLTRGMEPTRTNKTLMSILYLTLGCYLALSSFGYRALSYVFFSGFLTCVASAMVIRLRHRR